MQAAVVGACMLVLIAGDLQGFVGTNRNLCAHETAFSSFMFPNHGARMLRRTWCLLHLSRLILTKWCPREWCAVESPDKRRM